MNRLSRFDRQVAIRASKEKSVTTLTSWPVQSDDVPQSYRASDRIRFELAAPNC